MNLVQEGVETRRRVCIRCGETLKGQQRKFCSQSCNSYQHRLEKGDFQKPGVGSGGAQWAQDNHQYKTGIGLYSRIGFETHGRVCNRCSCEAVLIHHKDEDRTNNSAENLEPLCKRCHQAHHTKRDLLGRYTKV